MVALKHMDPLVGLDVHIILIPTPVGPVPTPLPHPYVGMIMDPLDYVPMVGTVVYVNGLPRATAGTTGLAMPPHIPMGGPFAPPPASNESEMFMGSATVNADGSPFSFAGCPVLSCQSIGMPAPVRPKGSPPASMMLPTTQAIPIPAGPMVMVGGPPTIIMPGMEALVGPLAKGMVSALKKAAKKSKKLGRAIKAASDRAHDMADAVMDKLKVKNKNARNKVHRDICSVTGHPVDIATGKVFTEFVDFELPGPLPVKFERVWYSTSGHAGPLGFGWHHPYDMVLAFDEHVCVLRLADGRTAALLQPKDGATSYDPLNRLTVGRNGVNYWMRDSTGRTHYFTPTPGRPVAELPLTHIVDRDLNQIRLTYDERGRLAQLIDSVGRALGFGYDAHDRIAVIDAPHPTQPDARVAIMRYVYSGEGDLVQAWDAMNQCAHFAYQRHLLVRETNRNGLSFYFEYDQTDLDARCTRTWGDGGIYDHKLTYDKELGLTVVENSLGHKTSYFHDGAMVTRVLDPFGNESTTELDENYRVIRQTDELKRSTSYEYDARGNLISVVGPDGAAFKFRYDAADGPVEATDALGAPWRWSYDERGHLLSRVDPLGREFAFRYQGPWLVAMVDPAGGVTHLGYDPHGNLHEVRGPEGVATRFHHDGWGQVFAIDRPHAGHERAQESNSAPARTLLQRDALGRVVRVEEPDGNVRELAYDAEGNVVHAKDRQHDVRFTYAGMGRLTSRSEAGTTVKFQYDTEEQLVAIANEHGRVYEFKLGPTGEVLEERGFGGLIRRYTRDAAGQVLRVDRPPLIRDGEALPRYSEYRYDPGGRVTEVKHSDGGKESYGYRADGELLLAAGTEGAVEFERDALGRITKEIQGGQHWVASEYDILGLRTKMTSSLGAEQILERNVNGDVTRVVSGAFEARFKRDALGLELERSLPGGLRSKWRRDKLGRPLQHQVHAGDKLVRATGYSWEPNDRLRMMVDGFRGPTHYTHDALGNLVRANYADGSVELRMPDAVGNLFRTEDRSERSYGPAGELLAVQTPAGEVRYAYDPEGNRVEKREPNGRIWRYEYNPAGMMSAVVRPDGSRVEFRYDPLGRRIQKRFRGQTTHWVWDGNNPLHEWVDGKLQPLPTPQVVPLWQADPQIKQREAELSELLAQGPPRRGSKDAPITWLFEPESFAPMARMQGGSASAIVTDHLGTPVAMFDAQGKRQWAASISVWGELRDFEGPEREGDDDPSGGDGEQPKHTLAERLLVPFRWPGQYEDAETGLYYNRFRYYDAEAGQYVTQDPIGLLGGFSLVAYVRDPNVAFDPLGLEPTFLDPNTVNFSQRTVSDNIDQYARDMKEGKWDWERSGPLRAMDQDGQLVSYDNRRLLAAQQAGVKVPVEMVNPEATMPGSKKTWGKAFEARMNDPRNRAAGGAVPRGGTRAQPSVVRKKGNGCGRG